MNARRFLSIATVAYLSLGCLFVQPAAAQSDLAIGDVAYRADFSTAESRDRFQLIGEGVKFIPRGEATAESTPDNAVVLSAQQPDSTGNCGARAKLPVEKIRGTRVRIEARVRAENVSRPPNSWNGIEVQLHYVAPGGQHWTQRNDLHGTFDWQTVQFVTEIPSDATEASITLGLERSSGQAYFDELKVTVIGRRRTRPDTPATGSVYKGHNLPRLRGAMIGMQIAEEDLRVLGGQWGANHIRWQLLWGGFPHGPADTASVDGYREWLDGQLDRLDSLLPVCHELGIKVVIDVHTPPGGRNKLKEMRIFKDAKFQQAFIDNWETIARRYKGNTAVWGYDLVNEPVEGVVPDGLMCWHTLATVVAKKVREIDVDHAIIVEPGPWGSPAGLDWFEPLDVPGVVYSVHMYKPHRFTHQGVHGTPVGVEYPGEAEGEYWDRDRLVEALRPAIEYQRDYGVHIYIGEFSAIRWAPSDCAAKYLRDCIEIFESHGWDWAYHAFREWDGWSVEHGSDPKNRSPAATPTGREKLLRSWYEKCKSSE